MEDTNDQLLMISGESATGKSTSLRNIRNPEKWVYLATEAGKRLPFKAKFQRYRITDPYQVHEAFEHFKDDPNNIGIIVDSLTFLMDMFETQYVVNATNTIRGWSEFQQYFKIMMQELVVHYGKPVIFTAHTKSVLNEQTMEMETRIPVKGALKNNGIEALTDSAILA